MSRLPAFLRRRQQHGGDPDAELRFWLEEWEPKLRGGELYMPDVLELLGEDAPAPTYEGRRDQEARAQVLRVLREAAVDDTHLLDGTTLIEIGPGPVGLPERSGARVALAVEPLAERLRARGLLLADPGPAVYLPVGAEAIPVLDGVADVVIARNSLDHVEDPARVMAEVARVLRPGGTLLLNVDVDHAPTPAEPHALTLAAVRDLVAAFDVEHEAVSDIPHGHEGRAVVIRARPRAAG